VNLKAQLERLENARRRAAELSTFVEQDEFGQPWLCLRRQFPNGESALFRLPAGKLPLAE